MFDFHFSFFGCCFTLKQRLGRLNKPMSLWPLAFKSYGPFLKSIAIVEEKVSGYCSDGLGLKKRLVGIFAGEVTLMVCITRSFLKFTL